MFDFGEDPQPLVLDEPPVLDGEKDQEEPSEKLDELPAQRRKTVPPKHDEIIWAWKVRITLLIYFLCSHPNQTLSK